MKQAYKSLIIDMFIVEEMRADKKLLQEQRLQLECLTHGMKATCDVGTQYVLEDIQCK